MINWHGSNVFFLNHGNIIVKFVPENIYVRILWLEANTLMPLVYKLIARDACSIHLWLEANTLMPFVYKFIAKMLAQRVQGVLHIGLYPPQYGFVPRRQTYDHSSNALIVPSMQSRTC